MQVQPRNSKCAIYSVTSLWYLVIDFLLISSVPTIYPLDIYARLSMVDALERLGIDRHFMKERKFVLDETYR